MVHKSHSGIIRFKMRKISLNFLCQQLVQCVTIYFTLRWNSHTWSYITRCNAFDITMQQLDGILVFDKTYLYSCIFLKGLEHDLSLKFQTLFSTFDV